MCSPKDQDDLGIQDLNLKNIALLNKWLFKLLTSNGLRQQILLNKYLVFYLFFEEFKPQCYGL
jgi:hypothetical protein